MLTFAAAKNGGLAQLARAPALHAGGQRFESVILHSYHITDVFSNKSVITDKPFFDMMYKKSKVKS